MAKKVKVGYAYKTMPGGIRVYLSQMGTDDAVGPFDAMMMRYDEFKSNYSGSYKFEEELAGSDETFTDDYTGDALIMI